MKCINRFIIQKEQITGIINSFRLESYLLVGGQIKTFQLVTKPSLECISVTLPFRVVERFNGSSNTNNHRRIDGRD